jgi:hypothetical protein
MPPIVKKAQSQGNVIVSICQETDQRRKTSSDCGRIVFPCPKSIPEDLVEKIAKAFAERLKRGFLDSSVKATSLGASGFTFICTVPGKSLSLSDQDITTLAFDGEPDIHKTPFQFVLKWAHHHELYNEQFCASIFDHFKLKAPNIRVIDNPGILDRKIVEVMQREKRSFANISIFGIEFMRAFKGATLRSHVKMSRIEALEDEEKKEIFNDIGKGAILDLLIGNEDRFFRLKDSGDGFGGPFVNPGNFMLELPLVAVQGDVKRRLKAVHFIDSTTTIFPKRLLEVGREQEELDCGVGGLFDDAPSESSSSLGELSESSTDSGDTEEEILQKYHSIVRSLIVGDDYSRFVDIICEGLKKEFQEEGNPLTEATLIMMKENIMKGCREMIERIKKEQDKSYRCFDRKITEIPTEHQRLSMLTLQLFRENVAMLY